MSTSRLAARRLNARPDTLDFRDRLYVPTLVEVPVTRPLKEYRLVGAPVLDQGSEGACTGFGLAAVANFLLRSRSREADATLVSPRMLYEMARRYDEWAGEDYDGSSARGAMKGWHKHGVCSDDHWRYQADEQDARLFEARWGDALQRPLGAYYRVNHKDLVAMHSAIAEVGVLYATATVHEGWDAPPASGVIEQSDTALGGHAFAIVAYDERGFWIQNSWGTDWGKDGFGLLSYDDWLANGTDVWVARLGAPVRLQRPNATAVSFSAGAQSSRSHAAGELRPHIVSLGNDGRLRGAGAFGTDAADVAAILKDEFPRVTAGWERKRILLYAHGGLVSEDTAVQRLADYRARMLEAQVYPLSLIWKTDYWTTLGNVLRDALGRRRPEGVLDAAKDFMLDRLDDALEPLARRLTGKLLWDEMKENALYGAARPDGGVRAVLTHLAALCAQDPAIEIHLVAHSAGSIVMAGAVELLGARGLGAQSPIAPRPIPIRTCTLWAPACSMRQFHASYAPAIESGQIQRFALFTLSDKAERDDHCANVYHKSLLYLVSNAFEDRPRIPAFRDGVPLLGLEKSIRGDRMMQDLLAAGRADWITSPNTDAVGQPGAARASSHGDFDDDQATLLATLLRITELQAGPSPIEFQPTAAGQRDQRQRLTQLSRNA